jgi:hypothetical protein
MFIAKLYKVIVASPKTTQEVTKSQNILGKKWYVYCKVVQSDSG